MIDDWKESIKRGGRRLAHEFEQNPVAVIGVCALAMTASAKLLKAGTEFQNARVWKKEVARRTVATAMKNKKAARYPFT